MCKDLYNLNDEDLPTTFFDMQEFFTEQAKKRDVEAVTAEMRDELRSAGWTGRQPNNLNEFRIIRQQLASRKARYPPRPPVTNFLCVASTLHTHALPLQHTPNFDLTMRHTSRTTTTRSATQPTKTRCWLPCARFHAHFVASPRLRHHPRL